MSDSSQAPPPPSDKGSHLDNATICLGREFTSIPIHERNKLVERVHGVEDIVSETDELVETSFAELDQALERITMKHAYNAALVQNRTYIQSRRFCLQFLRAECFDVTKAAIRMVLYCEEKLRRFDKRALARPLTLDDLSDAARTLLVRSGTLQILSSRDRVGRTVLFCFLEATTPPPSPWSTRSELEALGDAAFYLINCAADDEETQIKGALTITVVGNVASADDAASLQRSIERGGLWHPTSSPLRINANHMWSTKHCIPLSFGVLEDLIFNMGKEFRLLCKLHSPASYEETKLALKTFGIPVEHLPLSLDGCELRLGTHKKWIRQRPKKEDQMRLNPDFRGIDLPSCQDVCLQRGTFFHLHPGNLNMKALMEPFLTEYQNAASGRRRELNEVIIRAIHKTGGKFISRCDDGWFLEVLDRAEVNKSVGASFRSLLARTNKKHPTTSTIPPTANDSKPMNP